jgi:glycosyltransferase involved in cell wall biosynthesis
MLPLISIVMPLLNQERFLPESLKSVLDQSYKNLELLVVDGGSTDGSLAILKDYSCRDSRLKWFSGKDTGPAQAVNRAVQASSGEIIGWLNADDVYAPDAINYAVEALVESSAKIMVYGHGDWIDENSQKIKSYPTKDSYTPIEEFQNGCFICQPTVFFRRRFWTELGGLDESLEASFDFDLWIRAFKRYSQGIIFLDKPLACSRIHEKTITQNKRQAVAVEGIKILKKHLDSAPEHWLLNLLDEQLASYPSVETMPLELFKLAFEKVKDLLSPETQKKIEEVISNDFRLKYAKNHLALDIFSDGWAKKIFEIRVKNKPLGNYLIIVCSNEHPCPKYNKIYVYLGSQLVAKKTVYKHGNFKIKIPLNTKNNEFLKYSVHSSKYFIPDTFPKSRGDFREIPFKICDVYKQDSNLIASFFNNINLITSWSDSK